MTVCVTVLINRVVLFSSSLASSEFEAFLFFSFPCESLVALIPSLLPSLGISFQDTLLPPLLSILSVFAVCEQNVILKAAGIHM